MPMSWAVVWSSEVARNARPSLVELKSQLISASTAIAVASVIAGNTPTATPPPSGRLAVCSAPTERPRLSAEKTSIRPFCMMIERPNVTSSGGRMSSPSVSLSRTSCST